LRLGERSNLEVSWVQFNNTFLGVKARLHKRYVTDIFAQLNDYYFIAIIDIYFYETFSTPTSSKQAFALHSLDTLSDVKIKELALLF
jgi:hypothetical protein